MIRIATLEDFDLVLRFCKEFAAKTGQSSFFEEDKIKKVITDFLVAPNTEKIVFLYGDIGVLAAMTFPFHFGTAKTATELMWWVDPSSRDKKVGEALVLAYEYWATQIGCKLITMTCLDDYVGKFYEKHGYTLYERAYAKEITCQQ